MSPIFRRGRHGSPSDGEDAGAAARRLGESARSAENESRRQASDAAGRRQSAENETRRQASDAAGRRQSAENEERRQAADAEARRQTAANDARDGSGKDPAGD
jgi:hypothetical protein